MQRNIALNYGKNSVTDFRIYRVFSSALFNSVNQDSRQEFEEQMLGVKPTSQVEALIKNGKKQKNKLINY